MVPLPTMGACTQRACTHPTPRRARRAGGEGGGQGARRDGRGRRRAGPQEGGLARRQGAARRDRRGRGGGGRAGRAAAAPGAPARVARRAPAAPGAPGARRRPPTCPPKPCAWPGRGSCRACSPIHARRPRQVPGASAPPCPRSQLTAWAPRWHARLPIPPCSAWGAQRRGRSAQALLPAWLSQAMMRRAMDVCH